MNTDRDEVDPVIKRMNTDPVWLAILASASG